jgi:hypothetical protein
MKRNYYQRAIRELRKWDGELRRLEAQSRSIPPDKRLPVDAESDDLEREEAFTFRMLRELEQRNNSCPAPCILEGKIEESITHLRSGIENLAHSIRQLNAGE